MFSAKLIERVGRVLAEFALLAPVGAVAEWNQGHRGRHAPKIGGMSDARVQDLTHTVTADFPVFPGYEPPRLRAIRTIEEDGFYAGEIGVAEHTGTHLDAPAHFARGAATADLIPVERLVAPLAIIDIRERAAANHDARVTEDDIRAWEEEHGRLPAGSLVAMYSGWEERLPDAGRFLNLDDQGTPHFPGFTKEAAEFLMTRRNVVGVGVDTLSIDGGDTTDNVVHSVVLGGGAYGIENLANLGRVPPSGATVVVGGPKHAGASGGPARILAFYGRTIYADGEHGL